MLYPCPPQKHSIVRAKRSIVSVMHHFSIVGRSRLKDLLPRGQHLIGFVSVIMKVICKFGGKSLLILLTKICIKRTDIRQYKYKKMKLKLAKTEYCDARTFDSANFV